MLHLFQVFLIGVSDLPMRDGNSRSASRPPVLPPRFRSSYEGWKLDAVAGLVDSITVSDLPMRDGNREIRKMKDGNGQFQIFL